MIFELLFCLASARRDCLAQLIPLRPLSHMYGHDRCFLFVEDPGDAICTAFAARLTGRSLAWCRCVVVRHDGYRLQASVDLGQWEGTRTSRKIDVQ